MVSTKKFSEFANGGTFSLNDKPVGLDGTTNTIWQSSLQFNDIGTTAERPSTPDNPTIRYNTDDNDFEYYNGTAWKTLSSVPAISTTDNAIARFDGTSGDLQNSGILIDDSNNVTGVNTLSVNTTIHHAGDLDTRISFTTDAIDFQTGGGSRADLNNNGLRLGGANARLNAFLDEDNMVSNSDTAAATQQSIVNYIASTPGAAGGNDTEIQYNNSGTLDGISALKFNGTDITLTDTTYNLERNTSGLSLVDQSTKGQFLFSQNMNSTSKYTFPMLFGSSDVDFTTSNPKVLSAVTGVALEAYTGDTKGAMGIEFLGTPASPGASPTLTPIGRAQIFNNIPTFEVFGNAGASGRIALTENTDNGASLTYLQSADDVTSTYTLTLPPSQASGAGEAIVFDGSGNGAFAKVSQVTTPTTDEAIARFDGTSGALQNSNVLINDTDDITGANSISLNDNKPLNIGSGNDATLQYDGSDLLINPQAVGSGNFVQSAGSYHTAGISFDSGANTLQNYVVSTWTVDFTFSTAGDLSVTYSTRIARYTRVGNRVYFFISLIFTPTWSTASGNARISLPIASGEEGACDLVGKNANVSFPSGATRGFGFISSGVTYIIPRGHGSGSSDSNFTTSEFTSGSTSVLKFTGFYEV